MWKVIEINSTFNFSLIDERKDGSKGKLVVDDIE